MPDATGEPGELSDQRLERAGQGADHLAGVAHVHHVTSDQSGEIVRVDPAGEVVTRGNGAECPCIIVEPRRVVNPCRLRRPLAVTLHPLDGVVEPPGRPQADGWIVPRERRQLAGIGGLVEGEEDEAEVKIVAVGVEQRPQVARVLGGDGDVAPLVLAEAVEDGAVVVAQRSRMDLHDHAILGRHARHLHQHVRLEAGLISGE